MLRHKFTEKGLKIADKNQTAISALKVSDFDPQIDFSPFAESFRYNHQSQIARPRETAHTSNTSRGKKIGYNHVRDHSKRQLHANPMQPDLFDNITSQINVKFDEYSPLLREKMNQLSSLVYKKNSKEPHNVHFTSYLMNYNYSRDPILHSRSKRQSSFMKSVKAKNLLIKSMNKRQSLSDKFSSIEINNSSKYAKSLKMKISGSNIANRIKQFKNNCCEPRSTRSVAQNRQKLNNKSNRLFPMNIQEDCKPWQTTKNEAFHLQDDNYIIHV